jgi:hypothetical protein
MLSYVFYQLSDSLHHVQNVARLQPGSAQWDLHRSPTAIEFLIRFSSIGRSFVPLEPQGEARTGPLANKWLLGGYNYDII